MLFTGLVILGSGLLLITLAGIPTVRLGIRGSRIHTFDAWIQYRDFRFLWVANFFANSAQWLQMLSAGWLVQNLTAGSGSSALLVVTVGGLSTVPVLVIGPWGGVLGDRIDRKKVVMAIQAFMAGAAILFSLLVQSGQVEWWHVYAYILVGGTCWSITITLRQALVANTVPPSAFVNAYATNILTITGTRILGPLLGGVLIATLGFTWAFSLEATLYVGTVLALAPMATPYYQIVDRAGTASPLADMKEGLRYILRGEGVVLHLIVLGLIPNVLLHPVWFLLPVFTVTVLHQDADVGGYLLAATGIGGLAASLVIASVGFIFNRGLVLLVSMILSSVCVILFAQSHWLPAAMIFIGLMAVAQTTFRTAAGTLVQLLVPDHLRGRVTSLELYSQGFLILTSLLIGWFVDLTTVIIAIMAVGGLGLALSAFSTFTFHRVRQLA